MHARLALTIAAKGVPQDNEQAAAWYRKADDQGHADVQSHLVQATMLCRKAAEQGDAYAQRILGKLYCNGNGVPQDYVQAAFWYRKSGRSGRHHFATQPWPVLLKG